ncbi:hypothetical protein QLX52_06175 [Streptomyces albus]|uniref:hypothetical protein n=1 Tax=Streptomyces albus TaxID=1888 RepID=UPI0024ADE921|nr:hypothetical protein [Streptomyces albus]MDI6408422.1 hypothetical protein [Streptomyces albus]
MTDEDGGPEEDADGDGGERLTPAQWLSARVAEANARSWAQIEISAAQPTPRRRMLRAPRGGTGGSGVSRRRDGGRRERPGQEPQLRLRFVDRL